MKRCKNVHAKKGREKRSVKDTMNRMLQSNHFYAIILLTLLNLQHVQLTSPTPLPDVSYAVFLQRTQKPPSL